MKAEFAQAIIQATCNLIEPFTAHNGELLRIRPEFYLYLLRIHKLNIDVLPFNVHAINIDFLPLFRIQLSPKAILY